LFVPFVVGRGMEEAVVPFGAVSFMVIFNIGLV